MAQTSEAQITYRPRADTTPEGEVSALATVYRYLILEKGDAHDLTNRNLARAEGVNDKKGQDRHVRR
jgi:hypothetical protein